MIPNEILIQRRHTSKSLNDFLNTIYYIVHIFHGGLLAQSQTQGTMCDLMRQSNSQQYVRRIKRSRCTG